MKDNDFLKLSKHYASGASAKENKLYVYATFNNPVKKNRQENICWDLLHL